MCLFDNLEFGGMFDIDAIKDVQSLPCLKGGGFCEAKDGGIHYCDLLSAMFFSVSQTIPPPLTRSPSL